MGLHSGNDNFSFFEAQNMRQHIYDGAQPAFNPLTDEGRIIFVKNDGVPANNGFFRGSAVAWLPIGSGGGGGIVVQQNGVVIVAVADLLNFINDFDFVQVSDAGSGDAQARVDKHIEILLVNTLVPLSTSFEFPKATWRAMQIFYTVEAFGGGQEAGTITLVHNDAGPVGIRVDLITAGGASGVTFSADISGANVRLNYISTLPDPVILKLKPRAMPWSDPSPPPP